MKLLFAIFLLSLNFILIAVAQDKEAINQMLTQWHDAAAQADHDSYFGYIHEDGFYLGTDSTEIWTKEQFYKWSQQYFDRGKAWSFKANSRNIFLDPGKEIAWFDELVDYGNGTLRGSGVVKKLGNDWKIMQYVLSVPVPNEKFGQVMQVINEKDIPEKEE